MSVLFEQGFGLERIATGGMFLLLDNLNNELQVIEDRTQDADAELAERLGLPDDPVTLERVEKQNFHLGHVPSLIEDTTPMSSYPAVCVMAYSARPAGTDTGDHNSEYTDRMYIEFFVKSSPVEGETVCNKRAWRTADAVHNTIANDRTLGGVVMEMSESPTCIISEVFKRAENAAEGHGEDWFWQAARIEYGVNKYSPFEV